MVCECVYVCVGACLCACMHSLNRNTKHNTTIWSWNVNELIHIFLYLHPGQDTSEDNSSLQSIYNTAFNFTFNSDIVSCCPETFLTLLLQGQLEFTFHCNPLICLSDQNTAPDRFTKENTHTINPADLTGHTTACPLINEGYLLLLNIYFLNLL